MSEPIPTGNQMSAPDGEFTTVSGTSTCLKIHKSDLREMSLRDLARYCHDTRSEVDRLGARLAHLESAIGRVKKVERALAETLACHPSDPIGDLERAESRFDRSRDGDEKE